MKVVSWSEVRAWLELPFSGRNKECPQIITWLGEGIRDLKTAWNKAQVRAGFPDALMHDLRRTAVRNMTRAGIPAKQARLISGHRTDSVLDRYDIVDERDIQVAGQKLAIYLERKEELVSALNQDRKVRTKVRTKEDSDAPMSDTESYLLQ